VRRNDTSFGILKHQTPGRLDAQSLSRKEEQVGGRLAVHYLVSRGEHVKPVQ